MMAITTSNSIRVKAGRIDLTRDLMDKKLRVKKRETESRTFYKFSNPWNTYNNFSSSRKTSVQWTPRRSANHLSSLNGSRSFCPACTTTVKPEVPSLAYFLGKGKAGCFLLFDPPFVSPLDSSGSMRTTYLPFGAPSFLPFTMLYEPSGPIGPANSTGISVLTNTTSPAVSGLPSANKTLPLTGYTVKSLIASDEHPPKPNRTTRQRAVTPKADPRVGRHPDRISTQVRSLSFDCIRPRSAQVI